MPKNNFTRMRKLAEDFFAMHNDPSQIVVNEDTMKRLLKIHPGTLSEKKNKDGPIAWMLIIPTTKQVMEKFITGKINERDLLGQTPVGVKYEAIYLCSALVLPEFRGKDIAKKLVFKAVASIQRDHPIKYLFVWSFSKEGEGLAGTIAAKINLPLLKRIK
jgi:hypothetical protein